MTIIKYYFFWLLILKGHTDSVDTIVKLNKTTIVSGIDLISKKKVN